MTIPSCNNGCVIMPTAAVCQRSLQRFKLTARCRRKRYDIIGEGTAGVPSELQGGRVAMGSCPNKDHMLASASQAMPLPLHPATR